MFLFIELVLIRDKLTSLYIIIVSISQVISVSFISCNNSKDDIASLLLLQYSGI